MPRITVEFAKDRTRLGVLRLFGDDMEMKFTCPCLGKADNQAAAAAGNPERESTRLDGDTPTGTYRVLDIRPEGSDPVSLHSYGPNPVICIEGTSGDALRARIHGRFGLLIHGGDLSLLNTLRPTNGCVRLSNPDMASLLRFVAELGTPAQVIVGEAT